MINYPNQTLGVKHMQTEAQLRASKKYNAEHMAYQTFKVRKELLEQFKAIAARRGEKVNTLLKDFIISYIAQHKDEI